MFLTKMHGNRTYTIEYLSSVVTKDIPVLSCALRERIRIAIEDKLVERPDVFGKPLRSSLKGFRSLRVGDYRVIYLIEECVVLVVIIQHRSVVYREVVARLQ